MRTLRFGIFITGLFLLKMTATYAVPTINGTASAGEWTNSGSPYFLQMADPDEALIPQDWDISNVVFMQELDAFGGDGNPANDGMYLLIETYGNATLRDHDAPRTVPPFATVNMSGDFNADGNNDIFVTHFGGNPQGTAQSVLVANPAAGIPYPGTSIGSGCNPGGGCGTFAEGSALEYFLPAGAYGTPPNQPFPLSFVGTVIYDNGGEPSDDIVVGRLAVVPPPPPTVLIPEVSSSTFILLGFGLMGIWKWTRKIAL
jgi:hypothetical protein